MPSQTADLPDFAYNVQTRAARIGSQTILPVDGIRQTTNGYGRHFITVTIPVARVVIEDHPDGPVNHARPHFTVRP